MGFKGIYNSCNECNVYSYCVLFKWKAIEDIRLKCTNNFAVTKNDEFKRVGINEIIENEIFFQIVLV